MQNCERVNTCNSLTSALAQICDANSQLLMNKTKSFLFCFALQEKSQLPRERVRCVKRKRLKSERLNDARF